MLDELHMKYGPMDNEERARAHQMDNFLMTVEAADWKGCEFIDNIATQAVEQTIYPDSQYTDFGSLPLLVAAVIEEHGLTGHYSEYEQELIVRQSQRYYLRLFQD